MNVSITKVTNGYVVNTNPVQDEKFSAVTELIKSVPDIIGKIFTKQEDPVLAELQEKKTDPDPENDCGIYVFATLSRALEFVRTHFEH